MRESRHRGRTPHLIGDEAGATAIEYGLILALIFLALAVGVTSLGGAVQDRWNDIANKVSST